MSYKTILFSKLLETDLLFDNMGPVAQRLEQGTYIPWSRVRFSLGQPKNSLVMNHAPKLWVG